LNNPLEGLSDLLTWTKVWLAVNMLLINNADMMIIWPKKHCIQSLQQAFQKGNTDNKAAQLPPISCTEKGFQQNITSCMTCLRRLRERRRSHQQVYIILTAHTAVLKGDLDSADQG